MPRLPIIGATENADPHVVIVGAGGSRAACPAGDRNGLALPVMADLIDTVGLRPLIQEVGFVPNAGNFGAFYDDLARSEKHSGLIAEIENKVREYFTRLQLPDTATVYDYLLLSLQPKDLIATFNWDPLLAQACRRHEGLIVSPIGCITMLGPRSAL